MEEQSVAQHVLETASFTGNSAAAIGLPKTGRLLGLLHDFGKYSEDFRYYLRAALGLEGEEGRTWSAKHKGKIDHATSGAQLVWEKLSATNHPASLLVGQILSACIASHHSREGITDFIALDGSTPFRKRMQKDRTKTHIDEALANADPDVLVEIQDLLSSGAILTEMKSVLLPIAKREKNERLRQFHYGLLTRFLFSCLLDADRMGTANFEKPKSADFRSTGSVPDWAELTDKLEHHLAGLIVRNSIDHLRNEISQECRIAASRSRGIFTLTVPTGGGKTLASLRFALHHAMQQSQPGTARPIERIIYVIPYTSIIDQNARVVRDILGKETVLEHHSNLVPEDNTWRNRVLSENWDSPIVFTTSVQLLNALFDAPTNAARRMHQLANAVVVFDEIQTLPIRTIHLFNNAINFLINTCGTTAVFCTATQPLIGEVDASLGAVAITNKNEIVSDVRALFADLRRTQVHDVRRPGGWAYADTAKLAQEQLEARGSVLIVVNTKNAALSLYTQLQQTSGATICHLSTHMCPAHRKAKIDAIKAYLDPSNPQRVICISTQLIEAGVDLDFSAVIRSLAGLDSIAQAAGRCNRNGRSTAGPGPVFVINLAEENVSKLPDILQGQDCARRLLDDFKTNPGSLGDDLLAPAAMRQFYNYYFFHRASEMVYPLKAGEGSSATTCNTSLLDLLSQNPAGYESFKRTAHKNELPLRHALSTAAQAFRVIDAPTQGIVVPYGDEGRRIIGELASAYVTDEIPLDKQVELLRRAQQYTVNVFPHTLRKLSEIDAIHEVRAESGIYYLDDRYYHAELGVTHEALSDLPFQNV